MPLSREQIAARIRTLRSDLGFTQANVAEALGIHRPAVSELEAGRRALSSEELYTLSELFALPISAILSDSLPTQEGVLTVLFRRGGDETAEGKAAVRRFMQRCQDEQELETMLGIPHEESPRRSYEAPPPNTKREAIRQGEAIATKERLNLCLGEQPIRDPLMLLERQGVRVGPVTGLSTDDIDGLYFETAELGACVGVNTRVSDLGDARAAFTAAHEWAHWLLRDVLSEFVKIGNPKDDLREVRANAFAAALLMPRDGVRHYFEGIGLIRDAGTIGQLTPADVVQAMDHFGVSRLALLYRLINLNLISQRTADALKTFNVEDTAAALEIQFAKRGLPGTRLPQLAMRAWSLGYIGAGRAAALCDQDLASFKALAQRLGTFPDVFDGADMIGASALG
jgi:Zn-dependent peptidase ImmA (M78 family)/DNA-binding XRE family transcriptional regulator